MSEDAVILIFAKPAVPGAVKTRLIPKFTAEEAAEFHLAALDDTVETVRRAVGGRAELWVAGDAAALADFRRRYPGLLVRAQRGAHLGERLMQAFADRFAAGEERVLVVGSDHPTLPAENLTQALRHLRTTDVALGPSRDGGYYAVGLRRQIWPQAGVLFHDIPWSTAGVLQGSLERARGAGLEVVLLPEWYDVDRASDIELLRRDASSGSASARFLQAAEGRRDLS